MFQGCGSLETIYASAKFVRNGESYNMFSGCESIVGGKGTTYNGYYDGDRYVPIGDAAGAYAKIDNPPSAPGFFTQK